MNNLITELIELIKNEIVLPNNIILYLIKLKYMCEQEIYDFDYIVDQKNIRELFDVYLVGKYEKFNFNKLLENHKDLTAKEMLEYYLSHYRKENEYLHMNTLFYGAFDMNRNLSCYDSEGKSTYIIKNYDNTTFKNFKLFDSILGVSNTYIEQDNINPSNYSTLYIIDYLPSYRFIKGNDAYTYIEKNINNYETIILESSYRKTSYFSKARSITKYISSITIKNMISYITFTNNIKSNDDLITIYNNDDEELQIKYKELIDNNYRISYNIYKKQNKIEESLDTLFKENLRLIDELNMINKEIDVYIPKLLDKLNK